jgi:class 3 adenylate cyclase
MHGIPSGTPTLVFTDIEGSTQLLRRLGDGYRAVIAEHQRLTREAFARHGGKEVDTQGDSFFVAFSRPRDALLAAVDAQRSHRAHRWPSNAAVRVRIGVHTGPVDLAGERYVGLSVHRTARICAAAHGGQILVSQPTVSLLEDEAEALGEVELRDLGSLRVKDFERPVGIYQAMAPGLSHDHPPLRGIERASIRAPAASDADREQAIAALGEQVAGGRLTLQEYAERIEATAAASTLADLKGLRREPSQASVERRQPRPKRFTAVVFGDTERAGRWRLPRFGLACVLFGNADLDLRQTQLDGEVASITAIVLVGNIDIYVPEGIEVDFGGLAVLGHRRERGSASPAHPSGPLLRVRILSLAGTADLWRLPTASATRTFDEASAALERGDVSG